MGSSYPERLWGAHMDAESLNPDWQEVEDDGQPISASAIVDLDSPVKNPHVAPITIWLDVEVDEDEDEDGYSWRCSISEEDAGFGDATLDSGWLPSYKDAKSACWEAVVACLRNDGYSDNEIADAV